MRKLVELQKTELEDNAFELWMIEVYYTIRSEVGDWLDEYITVEKSLYLVGVDETSKIQSLLNEYEEKYASCKGYTITVTLMEENYNYCGSCDIK